MNSKQNISNPGTKKNFPSLPKNIYKKTAEYIKEEEDEK